VTFTLDGVSAGVAAVVAGLSLDGHGDPASLTPGTHLLIGTYSGDTYYAASTSVNRHHHRCQESDRDYCDSGHADPTADGSLL